MAIIENASLVFKDKSGNIGRVKGLTNADIAKIQLARDHVAKVVNQSTGEVIMASEGQVGAVQLASADDITSQSTTKVVTAKQLAEVKGDLSKVYKFKGSVESIDKLPSDAAEGDVYNITKQFTIDGVVYPAGTNVAAHIADPSTAIVTWDALGGSFDDSLYAKLAGSNEFTGTNSFSFTDAGGQAVSIRINPTDGFYSNAYTTLAGYVSIEQTPTSDTQAANKKYVDDAITDANAASVVYNASDPVASGTIPTSILKSAGVVFYPAENLLS